MSQKRGKERFKIPAARRALLDAGREILAEKGIAHGLSRVTLSEAIKRSGVPNTTAYRSFASGESPITDFHEALLIDIETIGVDADDQLIFLAGVLEDRNKMMASGDPIALAVVLRDVIRLGFNHRVQTINESLEWRAYISSVVAASAGESEQLHDALHNAARDTAARFVPMFEAMAELFGMRLRDGRQWSDFTSLLVAVLEGSALRVRVDSDFDNFERPTGPNGETQTWNGASIVAEQLVLMWAEPDPAAAVSADLSSWSDR